MLTIYRYYIYYYLIITLYIYFVIIYCKTICFYNFYSMDYILEYSLLVLFLI